MVYDKQTILEALQAVQEGKKTVAQTCRDLGVSPVSFHRWRKRYKSEPSSELDALREENKRLRKLLVDLMLDFGEEV